MLRRQVAEVGQAQSLCRMDGGAFHDVDAAVGVLIGGGDVGIRVATEVAEVFVLRRLHVECAWEDDVQCRADCHRTQSRRQLPATIRQNQGRNRAQPRTDDDGPFAAEAGDCQRRDDRSARRAEQIRAVDPPGIRCVLAEHGPDKCTREGERHGQSQQVGDQQVGLCAVPGDAVGVERLCVDEQVGQQRRQREPQCIRCVECLRPQAGEDRQQRATGAEAQQRQTDNEEGKVIELGDGKDACQCHL